MHLRKNQCFVSMKIYAQVFKFALLTDENKNMTISQEARGKLTFATTVAGLGVNLAMTIGYVYLTFPTNSGLALAILTGIAATYCAAVFFYSLFVLQNRKTPFKPSAITPEVEQSNNFKAKLFLAITIPSFLFVIGAGAVGTYQQIAMLGNQLGYPDSATLIASVCFTATIMLGGLLGGYDQIDKVYHSIKEDENSALKMAS